MINRTKRACQVCGKPFCGGVDCYYCPECAKAKKLDTVVKIRTCADCGAEFFAVPGQDVARIVHIRQRKRQAGDTKRPGQRDRLEALTSASSVGKSIPLFLAVKNIVPTHARGRAFWHGRGSIKRGTTKHPGRISKRWSGAKRLKRSVLTVCEPLLQIAQLPTALITAARSRQRSISA